MGKVARVNKSTTTVTESNLEGAGELPARAIDEARVLKVIHQMVPESRTITTLQDGVMFLLAEYDKVKRKAAAAPEPGGQGSMAEAITILKKVDTSLENLKQQLSVMRQYGIGAAK